MAVAILQCDSVLDKFIPAFGDYPEMIKRMFEAVNARFEYRVFDVQHGEYPDDPDAYDFYITTGSKASAYEDKDWIRQLIEFVRLLEARQRKLVGLCFGHQLIALARHGRVEKSARGWGVGVARNRVVTHPHWLREPEDELNMIVSHRDQITVLPDDTQVIASSDFCPCFVVQWGNHALSIQGHPEFLPTYASALIEHRRPVLGDQVADAGQASLAITPDNDLFTRWLLDFIAS